MMNLSLSIRYRLVFSLVLASAISFFATSASNPLRAQTCDPENARIYVASVDADHPEGHLTMGYTYVAQDVYEVKFEMPWFKEDAGSTKQPFDSAEITCDFEPSGAQDLNTFTKKGLAVSPVAWADTQCRHTVYLHLPIIDNGQWYCGITGYVDGEAYELEYTYISGGSAQIDTEGRNTTPDGPGGKSPPDTCPVPAEAGGVRGSADTGVTDGNGTGSGGNGPPSPGDALIRSGTRGSTGGGGAPDSPVATDLVSGSYVDLLTFNYHHFAYDYTPPHFLDNSGACGGCVAGPAANFSHGTLLDLVIERRFRSKDQTWFSSFGPGWYCNYDIRLDFYEDSNSDVVARVFDPSSKQLIPMTYDSGVGAYVDDEMHAVDKLELLKSDQTTTDDVNLAAEAILYRHDGVKYIFEIIVVDTSGGGYGEEEEEECALPVLTTDAESVEFVSADPATADVLTAEALAAGALATKPNLLALNDEYYGRLIAIEDRNGYELTITYKSWTQTEIDSSPERQFQMDKITDPYGQEATFTYSSTQQGGMWVVSKIDLPNGQDVDYLYDNGKFFAADHADGTQTSVRYSTNSTLQCDTVEIFDPAAMPMHRRKTVCLSSSTTTDTYGNIYNQESLVALRVFNGENEYTYHGFTDDSGQQGVGSTSDNYVRYGGDGMCLVYENQYVKYLSTWSYDSNDHVTGTAESYCGTRLGSNPGTLANDPAKLQDITGRTYSYTYDSDTFVTKKTYDADSTFEEWDYNSFKQVTRYRDREGRVTKYDYDTNGNLTKVKVGILEVSGSDVNQSEYAEWELEYYGSSHANKYLLKTIFDPLYSGTYTDLHRTDFEYDADHNLTKIKESADVTSGTRPETVFAYDTYGRLSTITDPESRVTTFAYDDRNRVEKITYNDNSTEHFLYGDYATGTGNLLVKSKDRNDVVTTYAYDFADRLTEKVVAAATDSNILDGNADDNPNTDPNLRHVTTYEYEEGTNDITSQVVQGSKTEFEYDYRDRLIETTRYPRASKTLVSKRTYVDNELFSTEDPYDRMTYYGYRDSDGRRIRTAKGAVSSFTVASETALMNLTRDSSANATKVILDTEYDDSGLVTTVTDGRNIDTDYEYDSRQRQVRVKRASGKSVEAKTETDYDKASNVTEVRTPRYFDSGDTEGYHKSKTTSTYNGRNMLASTTEAPGTSITATTSFTYFLDGRAKTTNDQRGYDWTTYWHTCCGRFLGRKDPAGHGTYSNTDYFGRVTHTITVSDYATHSSSHNPTDGKTLGERTIRYDEHGRVVAETDWLVARGTVDANDVPIAGLDSVSASDGLTTRYIYDDNLADSIGLDNSDGITVDKLGGGTFTLKLTNVINKLSDTIANGGAGVSFNSDSPGSAVVTINGEEELSVRVSDSMGRAVCHASIEPHFGTSPNALITWSTTLHDQSATISGFGDTLETQSIDALGKVAKSRTDGIGRTIETVDREANVSKFEYDANANQTKSRDPNSVGMDIVYDDLNRPTTRTDTQSDATSAGYDDDGNVVSTTDAKSKTTTCVIDARGRKKSCTDRLSGVTSWTYDLASNLLSLTDAQSKVTYYLYDNRGNKTQETYPDHVGGSSVGTSGYGIVQIAYDDSNRLLRKTDQLGDTVTYNYDLASRLTSRDYRTQANSPSGTIADTDSFTFDDASRILTAVSGRYSNTVTFAYDDAGRRESEGLTIGGQTYTTTTDYDDRSQVSKLTYPDSTVVDRTYTDRGQLYQVKVGGNTIDTRVYDVGGRLSTSTYGNGVVSTHAYRSDNLTSTITTKKGATTIDSFTYSYDANKNKTAETRGGVMSGYGFSTGVSGYDNEDRLTVWNRTDINKNQSWSLSLVGDWNSFTENAVTTNRTHSNAHEITAVGTTNLTHDVKGNLTTNVSGDAYTWDFDNQLAGSDTDGMPGDDVTFSYDALGRRTAKNNGTAVVVYASNTKPIPHSPFACQVIAEYTSGTSPASPAERYVYGSYIDEPIQKIGTGGTGYFHRNSQYSVNTLTDTIGTAVERYAYDAYGQLLIFAGNGTTSRSVSSFSNQSTFTGRRFDNETELYLFRARYYDPMVGRFVGRDPLEYVDGASLYRAYFVPGSVDPGGNKITKCMCTNWYVYTGPLRSTKFTTDSSCQTACCGKRSPRPRGPTSCKGVAVRPTEHEVDVYRLCGRNKECEESIADLMTTVRNESATDCYEYMGKIMDRCGCKNGDQLNPDLDIAGGYCSVQFRIVDPKNHLRTAWSPIRGYYLPTSRLLGIIPVSGYSSHTIAKVCCGPPESRKCMYFDIGNQSIRGQFGGADRWFPPNFPEYLYQINQEYSAGIYSLD